MFWTLPLLLVSQNDQLVYGVYITQRPGHMFALSNYHQLVTLSYLNYQDFPLLQFLSDTTTTCSNHDLLRW